MPSGAGRLVAVGGACAAGSPPVPPTRRGATIVDEVELLPFSKRTITSTRVYYDIVYARSLEEAVAQFGTSAFPDAQVDIIPASQSDIDMAERGRSWER